MEEKFELIAKTFQGLEEVLAQELTELGADDIQIGRRMVSFSGDLEMMYRANFCLRTAVRVLKPIKHFEAKDADDVYEAVKAIDWSRYLDLDTSFAVDSVVYSQEFRHSKFVAYKVKDAIVDYFRETKGKRPNICITNPDIKLNIHVADTSCTLSLDSSGESLHLRGYRVATVEAPINEVLAAALVKLSGWDFQSDLVDPFCGSGTILIEAALMARNIYPGVFRKSFGFERWKDFDRNLLDRIYNDDSQERTFYHKIYGYDLNLPAIEAAMANAKSAGVADSIVLQQQDIRKFTQPAAPAIMITNPPYGERLAPADLFAVYRALGERLKHAFVGGDAWVISSKEELFDEMGLRPSFKIPLVNGSIDCEYRKYQLFDGAMDRFRAAGGDIKTDEERRRMAEKKRFKQHRDFNRKSDDGTGENDEVTDYLRRKHIEFERNFNSSRGLRGDAGREARFRRGDRDGARSGRRDGDFGRREGGYGRRDGDFGRREGGYARRDGDFGRREGGYARRDGGFGRREGGYGRRDGDFGRREGGYGRRDGGFGRRDGDTWRRDKGRAPFDDKPEND